MEFTPIIGLEIHIQSKTKSKMYCSCSSDIYQKVANSIVCPVCLGMPGSLPVPNRYAIIQACKLAIVCDSHLSDKLIFDRKHYFYPDLPKGYQISQHGQVIATGGAIHNDESMVELDRIQVEEDTAKVFHRSQGIMLNYNRAGIPLIEIITKPTMRSVKEAVDSAKKIQALVQQYDISEASLEKSTFRIEPNISISTDGDNLPDYKVEIKNINSFRFLSMSLEFEIERQINLLTNKEIVTQETRGFNEKTKETFPQRIKEIAKDYRYFKEPDILEIDLSDVIETAKLEIIPINEMISSNKNEPATSVKNIEQIRQVGPQYSIEVLEDAVRDVLATETKARIDYQHGKETALKYLLGRVVNNLKSSAQTGQITEIIKEQLQAWK